MPVASQQKEPQVVQYHHRLLPKPPFQHHGHHHHQIVEGAENVCLSDDAASLSEELRISQELWQHVDPYQIIDAHASAVQELSGGNFDQPQTCHLISTHSPPIINLSPNLSPSSDHHRTSPGYDLRESTRRRSTQDHHQGAQHPMQHSPQIIPTIGADDSGRKSESPSRKRRKTSGNFLPCPEVVAAASVPSPSLVGQEPADSVRERRRSTTQRRPPQPAPVPAPHSRAARKSPGTRRKIKERTSNCQRERTTESPDRRAFQPPTYPLVHSRQVHPGAVLPAPSQASPTHHVLDIVSEQVTVSAPVTMASFPIPLCTGPHPGIPVCSSAHVPLCSVAQQPTWAHLPAGCMQLPGCSLQHFPLCAPLPVPHPHPMSTMLGPHHAHGPHHPLSHNPHPATPAPLPHGLGSSAAAAHQFSHRLHSQEEEAQMLAEHQRSMYQNLASGFQHHHHHHHHAALGPLHPPPGIILPEPLLHAAPPELYTPYSRVYHRRPATSRGRSRATMHPTAAYPPGFLLQFLAMLGNQPMTHLSRDPADEATEQENYEALLNLAERLGEAKPRGLSKLEIEQMTSYRFNSEVERTDMDQTMCVVCLLDFESRQLLRVLRCSHEFHAKCIDKWLKTNRTCPVCRADAAQPEASNSAEKMATQGLI